MSISQLFLVCYGLVFLAPLLLFDYTMRYLACAVLSISVGLLNIRSRPVSRFSFSLHDLLLRAGLPCVIVIGLIFYWGDNSGITDRARVLEGQTNYNLGYNEFVANQVVYVMIALSSLLLSRGLLVNSTASILLGFFLSASSFFASGTRWHLLLGIAPVIVAFISSAGAIIQVAAIIVFLVLMGAVAIMRSNGAIEDVATVIAWDLPSYNSCTAIRNFPSSVDGFVDFVHGQIFILIPRFLWPDKPLDQAHTQFMFNEIGIEAYDRGATILPGFLGSAWLYGGYLGVLVFTFGLVKAVARTEVAIYQARGYLTFWCASLIFIGLCLQFRNISVAYLLPALYACFCIWILKVFRGNKKAFGAMPQRGNRRR